MRLEIRTSVIIPVHNGAKYLRECLNSVVSQTLQAHEVIVVDDGSTDGSKEIVDQFGHVKYFRIEHAGVATARNIGLEKSVGDRIAFIDQDDLWTTSSLEIRTDYLNADQQAQIVTGRQKWFLHELAFPPAWVSERQVQEDLDGYLLGCSLIDRKLFERFGIFDKSFRFCSDFDWFFKLKDAGVPFHTLEEVVLKKRIHALNESRHAELSLKELSRAIFGSIKRKRADPLV
jgi:glycosyltransferase involved in cell wall biosynthesis